jgi:putative heme transporter
VTPVAEMETKLPREWDVATAGSPEPADARRGRGWRPWLSAVWWLAGAVVAVIAVRAALPEIREGIAAVSRAHVGLLVVAVVCEVVALATLPLTFRTALRMLGGHIGYAAALDGTLGAFALSRVVPAGGLAGGLYAARRFTLAGNPAAVATAAVTVASGITMLALGVVVVGGAVLEVATGRGSAALAWMLAAVLAAFVALSAAFVGVLRNPARLDRLCSGAGRLLRRPQQAETVRRHLTEIAPGLAHPRGLARVTGWSVVNWVLQLLALWIIFAAFGVAMPVGVLILGFGAAHLVTALPHTPGGLGVVEAGMTATYVAMGVPMGTAVVGVLCYRLLGHWLPVVAALPLVLPQLRRSPQIATHRRPDSRPHPRGDDR